MSLAERAARAGHGASHGRSVAMAVVDLASGGSQAAIDGFKSEYASLVSDPHLRNTVVGRLGFGRRAWRQSRLSSGFWSKRKGLGATLRSNSRAYERFRISDSGSGSRLSRLFFLLGLHRLAVVRTVSHQLRQNTRAYSRSRSSQSGWPLQLAGVVIYLSGTHRLIAHLRRRRSERVSGVAQRSDR